MRQCPGCGSQVDDAAQMCGYCGTAIPPLEEDQTMAGSRERLMLIYSRWPTEKLKEAVTLRRSDFELSALSMMEEELDRRLNGPQQYNQPQQDYWPQQSDASQGNYTLQQNNVPQVNYTPQQNYSAQQHYVPGSNAEGAVGSLVCGILGLFLCALIFAPIAIVLGSKALKLIQADPSYTGKGMATAGLAMGIIDLCLWGLMILIYIIAIYV